MTQASNTTPAKSLGEIALASAIKAVANDDSAAFTATVALGLVMANRQVERAETDKDITEKANKATFRVFLKRYAMKGHVVWRDSQHLVDGIATLKGKDREKAVGDYVDGGKSAGKFAKPEKARLVDGLAKLRTWSFRLMSDVCVNHAGVIRDIVAKKAAGASGDALAEVFREFVRKEYGTSFAALTERLAKPASEKEKPDVVEALFKRASDLTDTELALLVAKLEGMRLERLSVVAEVSEAFGGDVESETADDLPDTAEALAA
ncbi:hypothetical protein J4G48_0040425 [Bradyrhizobium barranii subsp. apii]|uniref:hypothetical protein n=1 Tax=Bradyrhizobium barranii TaxID=2992140 RepID=UPI001AA12920|nr:hypothetical protein [Bradyrhizobium barranii]UPT95423.1 hypothetical protein J4G48_0040425 [Bradyrhizobium barranii subsp. apii]